MNRLLIPQNNIEYVSQAFADITSSKVTTKNGYKTFHTPGFFYSRNFLTDNIKDVGDVIRSIKEEAESGVPTNTTFTKELMPEGTIDLFKEKGFRHYLIQTGMILEPGSPVDMTKDEHIERFTSENVDIWVDAMIEGFIEEGKKREDVIYDNLIKHPDMYFFGYVKDGEVMGTTLLHLLPSYSGIHEVAVPQKYRGKGIAKKLLNHALQIVKENGDGGVTLQASDMGRPIYEKLGFEKVSEVHNMYIEG